jgi:uncharacterized membrane protein YvlD (DUF360 family)
VPLKLGQTRVPLTLSQTRVPLKLIRRAVVIWAIEAAAFGLLTLIVPGLRVTRWETGVVAVLLIGVLNALVRPVVLLLAQNFGLALFGLISLVLNAAIVLLAALLLPGFAVDSPWTGFVVAFGLASLNTVFSGLLGINDDDSFYRNVIRWLERRRLPAAALDEPGTILIQIDGLAEAVLRHELDAGRLPTLAHWLTSGSHRLVGWECDVPSMTSSGQAGILYGNNADIPAFRWYDKSIGRLRVSNHPRDAVWLDLRQATDHGLLRERGSSVGNILTGSAEHCVATMSRIESESGQITATSRDLYDYFVNPYNLYRALGAMVLELALEYWQSLVQRVKNVQPRMNRGGSYPFVRAVTCVLLRDITTWTLVADMFAGRSVSYADYLGYDEVAHHAGPSTRDARSTLDKMDNQLRQLASAAQRAPRRYRFVVLSDHGQSTGSTFRQRFGLTLDQLIHQLMGTSQDIQLAGGRGEGWGQMTALLTDIVHTGGTLGRITLRLIGRTNPHQPIDIDPADEARERVERADVVVCASGNLALVYFAREPGRLTLEAIDASYPRLLEGVVAHPGIGFVLLESEASGGPVVLGRRGRRDLVTDEVTGDDPLAPFGPHTAAFLRRLSTYANVGDIVVNSLFEPDTGQVAAFEELVGCHGGTGGLQTRPFALYPSEWGEPAEPIVGAEQLHAFLSQHMAVSR